MKHYRKNQIKILAFILVFCVVFSFTSGFYNRCSHLEKVHATAAIGSLVPYILSSLGVVNVLSNGQVASASGSIVDQLEQLVADAMGSGIYTDSNGNYVFSNEFTQNVYEALSGSSDYDVRVLSNFTLSNDEVFNADYMPPAMTSTVASMRSKFDDYLVGMVQRRMSNGSIGTFVFVYDMSHVVGLMAYPNSTSVSFFGSNYNSTSVSYVYSDGYYNGSGGYSGGTSISSVRDAGAIQNGGYTPASTFSDDFFLGAPLFQSGDMGFSFYSNRSVLIARSVIGMRNSADQDQGIFFNNNGIPSVSQNVIENNNWENIYNNYVQNVAENYYSENGDNGFDQDLLRKWMRQYSNNIIAAIQGGLEDVEGAITTSNNWLKMIYEKLSELNTSSGGGGCSWSQEDIDYMLEKVNSIDLGQGNTTQQLILIYGLLDNILDAVRERNAPTPDMVDWLDNLPDLEILDTIAKMDIVTSALQAVVPMCYLSALGAILGGLATDPEPIDVEIPFKFTSTNGIDIDESMTIDLEMFDSVHTILIAAEVLAYICFLMIASFRLLHLLLDIFSGGG